MAHQANLMDRVGRDGAFSGGVAHIVFGDGRPIEGDSWKVSGPSIFNIVVGIVVAWLIIKGLERLADLLDKWRKG